VLERGAKFASSLLFSHSYANVPASLVAIEYRLRGHHGTVCTGLTSGATALAEAVDALRDGRAEVIFAGGVEALSEPLLRGLSAYLARIADCRLPIADCPESEQSQIANRKSQIANRYGVCSLLYMTETPGIVLGEGAGVFVLETVAHAAARGATAWAHLTGVGLARSRRWSSGDGLERAIRAALQEAGRRTEEVDAVFASANGWPAVDDEEAAALRAVFPTGVPVTALKSRWGEPGGAGAALNLAAALAAFADGQIPATLPCRERTPCRSPAAGLDLVTDPRPADLHVVLLTSVDFGGGCVSVVVER
jgi:3-oxoacyl-(acyl-carrier-protein) synthase